MSPGEIHLDPTPLWPFEDIIDGYFPLALSLQQMLERLRVQRAFVTLAHAPIMEVPDLPCHAPVPLNIRDGRAGMVADLQLWCEVGSGAAQLCGQGAWRWLEAGSDTDNFDPMTRLAEPALVRGFAAFEDAPAGGPSARLLRSAATLTVQDATRALGHAPLRVHGPFVPDAITRKAAHGALSKIHFYLAEL